MPERKGEQFPLSEPDEKIVLEQEILGFNKEQERKELDVSELAQKEYYSALEKTLMAEINEKYPLLPKPERRELDLDGKKVGEVEQKRIIEKSKYGPQDLWLIVDFDDVINHTTNYMEDLHGQLSETAGLTVKKLKELYEQSKIINEEGKKVFRFETFIERAKEESSHAKDAEISELIQNIDYSKYIDEGVKRALIASRSLSNVRFSSATPATIRISILTYGDPQYQKLRVDGSGIGEVVDEVIYTEGSKKDVVDSLVKRDYSTEDTQQKIRAPFTITFDDSPDHIDDYAKLKNHDYINVRFRHPQAKRYKVPHIGKEVVESEESSQNQAAVDMFEIAQMATMPESHQILSPFSQYDYQKDRKERERILSSWGYYPHEDVTYVKKEEVLTRSWRTASYSNASREFEASPRSESHEFAVSQDGEIEDIKSMGNSKRYGLLQEFIKEGLSEK
ncbi:MAG: hypothetical protein EXS48_01625 [Candidatus Staskawiczbacteria bacterium]|nr:hypothetical protein [Candidatus Staskawiczbacteria bacterium]